MTKIGSLELFTSTAGKGSVQTLTGNSGGAIGTDGSANINIIGDNVNGINTSGNPGTHTLTISGIDATTSQTGVVALATDAETILGVDATKAIVPSSLSAKLGTQTAHSLLVAEGSGSALNSLGVATNGQIPIGSTGSDPVLANLTAGANVTITNSPGGITISSSQSLIATAYTSVSPPSYNVMATDYYISVNSSAGAVTINLPNSPSIDQLFVVKDRTGTSEIHPITITTSGGTVDIDGAVSYQISTAYSAINLLFNGTNYEVY